MVAATLSLTNTDTNTANTSQNPQKYSDQETFTLSVPNATANGLTATTVGTIVTFYVGTQNMGTCTLVNVGAANSCSVAAALIEPSATAAGVPTGTAANGQMAPVYAICVYQVKSTAVGSLSVAAAPSSLCPANTPPGSECAAFVAKGVINDVTIPSGSTSVDGGVQVVVNLVDNGNQATDAISFQVNASSNKGGGLWYSSDWTGTTTIQQLLSGGNLSAH